MKYECKSNQINHSFFGVETLKCYTELSYIESKSLLSMDLIQTSVYMFLGACSLFLQQLVERSNHRHSSSSNPANPLELKQDAIKGTFTTFQTGVFTQFCDIYQSSNILVCISVIESAAVNTESDLSIKQPFWSRSSLQPTLLSEVRCHISSKCKEEAVIARSRKMLSDATPGG